MDPFEIRNISSTSVDITALGLGGAPISGMIHAGGLYGGTDYNEALRIIKTAYELGIRYFDTAPLYGLGRSEGRYSAVLPQLPRSSFVISTKAGRILTPIDQNAAKPVGPEMLPVVEPTFDYTRDGIRRSLEDSLTRLKLDSIDILLLHDPDVAGWEAQATETALPALIELKSEGVVGAVGCGINEWEMPARFVERLDLDVVLLAGRYTLLDLSALDEFMPLCEKRDVSVVIGGPYNSGILARDLSGPVTFDYEVAPNTWVDRAKALKSVCDDHSVELKAAALQFVLAHPAVASVVPGSGSIAELQENTRLITDSIPEDFWLELKSGGLLPEHVPTP